MGRIEATLDFIKRETEITRSTLTRVFTRMDESDSKLVDAVSNIRRGCREHGERIQGNSAKITVFLWLLGILVSVDLFLIGWIIAH